MANRPRSAVSWPGSDKFYNPYIGKGLVLFTGPDGIRDHKVTVIDPTYVGIGTMSPEGTSDLNYLWRASKSFPPPLPKHQRVGEIGWGIKYYRDLKNIGSGHQIEHGEFRRECEDRHTHLYQNPWSPGPHEMQVNQLCHQNLQKHTNQLASRPSTAPAGSARLASQSAYHKVLMNTRPSSRRSQHETCQSSSTSTRSKSQDQYKQL